MVGCNHTILNAPRPGKDRTRAATKIYNRCTRWKRCEFTLNDVDLSAVNPAKKTLIFWTAVIV